MLNKRLSSIIGGALIGSIVTAIVLGQWQYKHESLQTTDAVEIQRWVGIVAFFGLFVSFIPGAFVGLIIGLITDPLTDKK